MSRGHGPTPAGAAEAAGEKLIASPTWTLGGAHGVVAAAGVIPGGGGLVIHAAVGRGGGTGMPRGNRSG